ncbi:MAG: D-alanyl-D-alanine carboxypeptidase/D-alanyl-D-alanine-endopeptidase [Acidobacteria bacterium]|nr:D-alanyl-D-alanine carboxypeptidase/D-alanyl-D-alanine-endopeptidase [Acidobacteriota bacterium]
MKPRRFRNILFPAVLFLAISTGVGQTPVTKTVSSAPTRSAELADLESSIQTVLSRPEYRRGQIGFKAVSAKDGRVIFEHNSEKYFMPASNMKNFTVATALEKLTPDFRFVTSIYSREAVRDGTIAGPLRVFGRGDVSLSYTSNNGDYFKGIDRVADAIIAAGVKKIEGDIIGDETYFSGSPLPTGWEWDDLQFYYGAEVSALPVNDNAVALSVKPGPVGYSCSAQLTPVNMIVRVVNTCITAPAGSPRTLRIHKKLDQNIIEISGELPVGNAGYSGNVAVSRPAEMFVSLLKQRLLEKGVEVTGRTYAMNDKARMPTDITFELAKVESPPLSVIAAMTMKPSQNMYTETLLWTLGEEVGRKMPQPNGNQNRTSSELGIMVVRDFMKQAGAAEDSFVQYDGSGLSRHNIVSPDAVIAIYDYMGKRSRFAQAWRDSLTIGGVDGTLRNRFKGTRGEGNVRGKTGTINQVSALSGYLTTAAGEEVIFSALVNGIPETRTRVALIDELVMMLVNFNGRVIY